jgi:hypothetical protein
MVSVDFASSFYLNFFGYLLYFLYVTHGLAPGCCDRSDAVLTVCRCFTDPMMGVIADRNPHSWGVTGLIETLQIVPGLRCRPRSRSVRDAGLKIISTLAMLAPP